MHKKFEVNQTKIKGGYQSYTKAAPQQSENDLTLLTYLDLILTFVALDWILERHFYAKDQLKVDNSSSFQMLTCFWVCLIATASHPIIKLVLPDS